MSPSIEDYIRSEKKRGVTEAQLRQALSSYSPQIVNHAFDTVKGAAQKKLLIYVGGVVGIILLVMGLFFYAEDDDGEASSTQGVAGEAEAALDKALAAGASRSVTCGEYCSKVMAACRDSNRQYLSEADCTRFCESTAGLEPGVNAPTPENTIGCRIYNAELASKAEASVYCPSAGAYGGGSCGSLCENYCDLAERQCGGAFSLFEGKAACLGACSLIPQDGVLDATEGNSIQCRLNQLKVAFTSPKAFCERAGAISEACGGVPRPTCDEYCGKVLATCGSSGETAQYASERECLTYCTSEAKMDVGAFEDQQQNTIGCRIYHAKAAAEVDPEIHCPHAGALGANICGSYCETYCELAEEVCSGSAALYASKPECMSACSAFSPSGKEGDTSGNSVQCRFEALRNAVRNPAACANAGVSSGMCGGSEPTCDEYCGKVMQICSGANEQYVSEVACLQFCQEDATLTAGGYGDLIGDTIGCRLNHTRLAAVVDPEIHCNHAGRGGGGVCAGDGTYSFPDQDNNEQADTNEGGIEESGGQQSDDPQGDRELSIEEDTSLKNNPPPADLEPAEVAIRGFQFVPAVVQAKVGQTVIWTNEDRAPHLVKTEDGVVQSSILNQGETFAYTFSVAGRFDYKCGIHPEMWGTIIVS